MPIGRVLDATSADATFDQRRLASLPLSQGTVSYTLKDHFPLPLGWAAFVQAYDKVAERSFDESNARVLANDAATLFPKGEGSQDLLYRMDLSGNLPHLINQGGDGTWSSSQPDFHATDLTQDGSINVGDVAGIKLLHLTRAAHASDDAFYGDSKGFMDLALKGLDIRRSVGPDRIRVTSLGAAISDTVFTDDYGRKWQERAWAIPYLEAFVVAELLPTPDGYDGVLLLAPSLVRHETHQTARWVAQHIDTRYSGTLSQWQAMLKRVDLLPKSLQGVKLTHRDTWSLETPRVTSSISTDILALNDRSILTLGMAYLDEKPKVGWEIQSIRWELDDRQILGAEVRRSERPPQTAQLAIRNQFDSLAAKRSPYDGSVIRESAEIYSATRILDVPGRERGTVTADLKYAMTLSFDKYQPPPLMETKFAAMEQGTRILERSTGNDIAAVAHTPGDEGAGSDVAAAQQAAISFAQQMQSFIGRDIRGREMSDDIRDYMQAFNKQLAGKPPTDAQKQEVKKTFEWLRGYWINYPALGHNRDMWPEFLRRNRIPGATQHNDQIVALQIALLSSLSAGYPSEASGQRARDLVRAYIEERKIMVRSVPAPEDSELIARRSPCPAPVTAPEGTHTPSFLSTGASLDQLWPVESKRLGEEGSILIRINSSAQGCVERMAIQGSSGSDSLDSTVMRYAESISFKPASKDGKAVETTVTLPVVFKLAE
jgi:TonB family protein